MHPVTRASDALSLRRYRLRSGEARAAALSFAPVSLAPARRLTFPDQQQNLQNAAEQSVANQCDGGVKNKSSPPRGKCIRRYSSQARLGHADICYFGIQVNGLCSTPRASHL
jgi:hypothetical protein